MIDGVPDDGYALLTPEVATRKWEGAGAGNRLRLEIPGLVLFLRLLDPHRVLKSVDPGTVEIETSSLSTRYRGLAQTDAILGDDLPPEALEEFREDLGLPDEFPVTFDLREDRRPPTGVPGTLAPGEDLALTSSITWYSAEEGPALRWSRTKAAPEIPENVVPFP